LFRGDKQLETAETEGPVCRVESILLLFQASVLLDLQIIKIDFVAAYLNTKMPEAVKHKWVLLDRYVSNKLIEKNEQKWKKYLRDDGKILVEVKKLIYGYKEAAHYWNKCLINMFIKGGYKVSDKDPCVVHLRSGPMLSIIAITVDDCCCAISKNEEWKSQLLKLCKDEFDSITVEEGDSINIISMNF
jgi:hypothetical protein